jgi:hypothetical protein
MTIIYLLIFLIFYLICYFFYDYLKVSYFFNIINLLKNRYLVINQKMAPIIMFNFISYI